MLFLLQIWVPVMMAMQQHRTEKGFFDYDRSIVALLNEETELFVKHFAAVLLLLHSCDREF